MSRPEDRNTSSLTTRTPSLADGSHGELGLEGHPQFAHDDDVERGVESLRHLEGHGHPAARKTEHHDIAVPDLGTLHDFGQLAACIYPIAEPHDDLLATAVSPLPRSHRQSRWSLGGPAPPARPVLRSRGVPIGVDEEVRPHD